MQIKFLGTGGAFDANLINSAAILSIKEKRYLLDCGHSVFPILVKKGVADKIDAVVITHLHDDHVGSLSTFAFYCHHVLGKKLTVLVPLHDVFEAKLRQLFSITIGKYEKYVDIKPLEPAIQGIETTNFHTTGMESFSYLFKDEEEYIAYSGDLGDPDLLFNYLQENEYDPQHCTVFHDTSFIRSSAHAYYKDLMKWQQAFVLYAYHCDPSKAPSDNTLPLVYNSSFLF